MRKEKFNRKINYVKIYSKENHNFSLKHTELLEIKLWILLLKSRRELQYCSYRIPLGFHTP